MKILTIFAHPGAASFDHSVLGQFDAGLRDAGHEHEVVDVYARGLMRLLQERFRAADVTAQQRKVSSADALAFIAPTYFAGFPGMLRRWIECVFTMGFAFRLTPGERMGERQRRVPLLTHEKALVMQSTGLDRRAYESVFRDAMRTWFEEFRQRYPGIKRVQHEYFYNVDGADEKTLHGYLSRAYALGRHFSK